MIDRKFDEMRKKNAPLTGGCGKFHSNAITCNTAYTTQHNSMNASNIEQAREKKKLLIFAANVQV